MSRYEEVHKLANLNGAGDARPTALQIIDDEGVRGKLNDKVILITGISSGIGVDTLRALHTTGAHVFGTVRDLPKGQKVVDQILSEEHQGGGKIDLIELDQSSLANVRAGAKEFLSRSGGKLNILVANAGIMAQPYGKTVDGFEQQFATNHLAHFLLFNLLKDALLSSATKEFPSRYVSVASAAHNGSPVEFEDINFDKGKIEYDPWKAYSQSKTANIWISNAIERRYANQNLHSTSLHPGGILETGIAKHLGKEFEEEILGDEKAVKTLKSAAQGAATTVWAAVGKVWQNKGGRYLCDCAEIGSFEEVAKKEGMWEDANEGYAAWAYDTEGEERLWRESLEWVGLKGE